MVSLVFLFSLSTNDNDSNYYCSSFGLMSFKENLASIFVNISVIAFMSPLTKSIALNYSSLTS